ncbi:MAG: GNAT family N-acetyltransferase, partial [Acidobacteria bacterium]|nr:GNAT family N-acetyltransferase [Acidobacteriota bacterium]
MGNLVTNELEPVQVVFTETTLNVEVVSDHSAFLNLEPVWDRLVERANIDHPFVTFPWVHTWWKCFGSGRKLHILVVKAGDEVIGIAPLMLTKRKIFGVKVRCLEFLANGHTPRFDVIVSRWPLQVYRAMWNHLQAERNLWDVLLLCQIPEGCPTLEQFSRLAEENQFAVGCWRSANAPYLLIQGDWESYLKSIKSKFRNNLCRRLRKLSELGQVTFEVVSSGEALGPALQDGLQLEGAAWKDKQGTSIRSRPEVRQFYTQLADKFAELGWLHLCFLKCNDRRIAFHYSLFYKSKSYLLKPGYD